MADAVQSAQALVSAAADRLRDAGVPDPVRDARALLAHAMGIKPARLTLVMRDPVPPPATAAFAAAIDRRAAREPVSHITGTRLFWDRAFQVTPSVLDPRPETEILIAAALETPFTHVLDLGTGSGAILLTLLAEQTGATGIGTDLSAEALAVAAKNRAALGLQDRAILCEGPWFDALPAAQSFDLIVSNPPYIAASEMPGLAPEVRDHEPAMALTDGGDGLTAYRAIAAGLWPWLAPGGRLLLEIGPTQAAAVSALLSDAGLIDVRAIADFDNRPRVITARKPG